ncbi:MAG: PAS domain-containing protein [Fimbriimonadaceae bacterium]
MRELLPVLLAGTVVLGCSAALFVSHLQSQAELKVDPGEWNPATIIFNVSFACLALTSISLLTVLKLRSTLHREEVARLSNELDETESQREQLKNRVNELNGEITSLRYDFHSMSAIQSATLERFTTTFRKLPTPCFTLNELGRVMEWNDAAIELFDLQPHEVVDKELISLFGREFVATPAQDSVYSVFLNYPSDPVEFRGSTQQGTLVTGMWQCSPVLNNEGRVVGAVTTLYDTKKTKKEVLSNEPAA